MLTGFATLCTMIVNAYDIFIMRRPNKKGEKKFAFKYIRPIAIYDGKNHWINSSDVI